MKKFLLLLIVSHAAYAQDSVVKKIDELNKTLSNAGSPACGKCSTASSASKIPKPDFESERQPLTDVNPAEVIESISSYSHANGYNYSVIEKTGAPAGFNFYNYGPNKIVPKIHPDSNRQWSFNAENWARQDIYISVMDQPNDTNSQIQNSYLYFFPRKNIPSIKRDGDRFIITLPTGEKAYFNAKTKEALDEGALRENGPISKGGRIADPPKVSYQGTGVLIRADSRGTEPRKGGFAMVTKSGKSCKVPKSELWPDQRDSSLYHFKFSSDAELNSYLIKKCKFGLD